MSVIVQTIILEGKDTDMVKQEGKERGHGKQTKVAESLLSDFTFVIRSSIFLSKN